MFRLPDPNEPLTVTVPVTIPVPQDGGRPKGEEIDVTFQIPLQDQLEEALADVNGDVLARYLVGFDKVNDAAGKPLVFSDENKASLLRVTYARTALSQKFFAVVRGEGRLGN